MQPPRGGMAEWLKAHAWKACIRETVSWVRIPLPPPAPQESLILRSNSTAQSGQWRRCFRNDADAVRRNGLPPSVERFQLIAGRWAVIPTNAPTTIRVMPSRRGLDRLVVAHGRLHLENATRALSKDPDRLR